MVNLSRTSQNGQSHPACQDRQNNQAAEHYMSRARMEKLTMSYTTYTSDSASRTKLRGVDAVRLPSMLWLRGPSTLKSTEHLLRSFESRVIQLSVTATALECSKDLNIMMRQIKNRLRKASSLDNASDLDCAFLLNQLSYCPEQRRRELRRGSATLHWQGQDGTDTCLPRNTIYTATLSA